MKSHWHIRWLAALLVALSLAIPAAGNASILVDRPNPLGNANEYGYLRIKRELGSIDLGNGASLDVDLIFNTDPRLNPGALGPGWSLPLFNSTVFEYNQGKVIWDGPDGERRFFTIGDDDDAPQGKILYEHQGGDLRAVFDERRNEYLISSKENPTWAFEYRDGRLERFRLGEGTKTCRLDYNGRGFPKALIADHGNEILLEVEYAGMTRPELIRLGDTEYTVELGDGEMMSPDGKTPYHDYRLSYLRVLGKERFTYSLGEPVEHVIQPARGKREAKTATTPVNRLTLVDANGESSWAEWEARTGFITADSGGKYDVKNRAFDPFLGYDADHVTATPGNVSIKRLVEGESNPEQWSYNWNSGVRTYTDAAGNLMRKTFIMAPGESYLSLRKIERKDDQGGWELLKSYAYSPEGDLLREVDWLSDATTNYIRDDDVLRVVRDDQLIREDRFSNGELMERYRFENGQQIREVYHRGDGLVRKLVMVDGKVIKTHAFSDKWIIYRKGEGKWFFRERESGLHYIVLQDGRVRLKEMADGKMKHVGWVEDPVEITEIFNTITKINHGI